MCTVLICLTLTVCEEDHARFRSIEKSLNHLSKNLTCFRKIDKALNGLSSLGIIFH